MAKRRTKRKAKETREKRVDATNYLSGRRRGAVLKEEVWYEGEQVVKYSIAYINERECQVDNGRVLGYDSGHGYHHRHFMGSTESIEFTGYQELLVRFHEELNQLWKEEDEKCG